jgi:hypothetical protein
LTFSPFWPAIKTLFDRAIDRTPKKRAEYLGRACRGDDSLRRAVKYLIKSHEKSGSFLDGAVNDDALRVLAEADLVKPGDMIAHYTIRHLLGEAGMGRVYLASDNSVAIERELTKLPESSPVGFFDVHCLISSGFWKTIEWFGEYSAGRTPT